MFAICGRPPSALNLGQPGEARHELLHPLADERHSHLFVIRPRRARHDDPLAEHGVDHVIAGAEPGLPGRGHAHRSVDRRGPRLAATASTPRRWEVRDRGGVPLRASLLVTLAAALPVELLPAVALFGLDLAAELDPVRQLAQE